MKKVRYFCNPGKTELNGIKNFLYKINSGVSWQRDFPARDLKKPNAPRPRRSDDPSVSGEGRRSVSGVTGKSLREAMLDILGNYPDSFGADSCDAILLIDDADCEFASLREWEHETNRLAADIVGKLGRSVPFYYLLESPEVEAWFLADWDRSFGSERVYRKVPGLLHQMRKHLKEDLLVLADWADLEWFGGPRKGESCTRKLSGVIEHAFKLHPDGGMAELVSKNQEMIVALAGMSDPEERLAYSKDYNGGAMLTRINPAVVAETCRHFFAPVYRQLSAL